jgi:hypothetical protein
MFQKVVAITAAGTVVEFSHLINIWFVRHDIPFSYFVFHVEKQYTKNVDANIALNKLDGINLS